MTLRMHVGCVCPSACLSACLPACLSVLWVCLDLHLDYYMYYNFHWRKRGLSFHAIACYASLLGMVSSSAIRQLVEGEVNYKRRAKVGRRAHDSTHEAQAQRRSFRQQRGTR